MANVRDICTVVGGARSCSREYTTLIYPPSLNGLQNFLKIFYSVQISVACATQLRGLNGCEHQWGRAASCSVCTFLLSRQTKNTYQYRVGRKFQQVLKEILSLFTGGRFESGATIYCGEKRCFRQLGVFT